MSETDREKDSKKVVRKKRPRRYGDGYLGALKVRGDLYTPIDERVLAELDRMMLVYGNWCAVSAATGLRRRLITKIRRGTFKCISMTVWDRALTHSHSPLSVRDFMWYTVDELIERGIWKDTRVWVIDKDEEGWEQREKEAKDYWKEKEKEKEKEGENGNDERVDDDGNVGMDERESEGGDDEGEHGEKDEVEFDSGYANGNWRF